VGIRPENDSMIRGNAANGTNQSRFGLLKQTLSAEWKNRKVLYLMCLPALLQIVAFRYLPLGGLIVAFKDYSYRLGILGSPWVGFSNFRFLFGSFTILQVAWNTILLNLLFIVVPLFIAMIIALMFNELRWGGFKKVAQSIMLLPQFISWIVVGVVVYQFFNFEYGSINNLLKSLHISPLRFYSKPEYWRPILTAIRVWHDVGWNSVIFLATLAGIDPQLYEAATIDGAGKMSRTMRISVPYLYSTVSILVLMAIGRLFTGDFAMIYGIIGDNPPLYPTTDVIDTYVYRALRQLGDVGMASAAGFLQSILGFVVVMIANWGAKRMNEEGGLF